MFMSEHNRLQKSLFGEILLGDDFHKLKKLNDDINDDDYRNNGNIYKISNVLNDTL
jgi:hypothetical protein